MRGIEAVRAALGFEHSMGSWFQVPVHEKRTKHGNRPFGQGKHRPVIMATRLGPDAVLHPRSTKPGGFPHAAHRDCQTEWCKIDKPGWVILAVRAAVDHEHLNDRTHSCDEPEDSPLLAAIRNELRP